MQLFRPQVRYHFGMADRAHTHIESYDREQILAAHGLPPAFVFETAVRQGDVQRRQTTANDVKSAGGYNAWARTTRVLRDLTDNQWEPVDAPIPAVKHGSTLIIAVAGDRRTGLVGPDPKTKNKRKKAWRDMLGISSATIPLFDGYGALPVLDHDVWVLLACPTVHGVRAEISKPVGVDALQRRIVEWNIRVLFGELRPDDGKSIERTDPQSPAASGEEFPHEISRRRPA
jgi:hypothetical protein